MITMKELNKAYKKFETKHAKVRVILFKEQNGRKLVVNIAEFLKADATLKSGNLASYIANHLKEALTDEVTSFSIEGIPSHYDAEDCSFERQ